MNTSVFASSHLQCMVKGRPRAKYRAPDPLCAANAACAARVTNGMPRRAERLCICIDALATSPIICLHLPAFALPARAALAHRSDVRMSHE